MNIKQHIPRIGLQFLLITPLASGFASADAERELLLNVSVEKMDAIVIAISGNGGSCGCFIGEDGLAVFQLLPFAAPKAPDSYYLNNRGRLKPPVLRWFFDLLKIYRQR